MNSECWASISSDSGLRMESRGLGLKAQDPMILHRQGPQPMDFFQSPKNQARSGVEGSG